LRGESPLSAEAFMPSTASCTVSQAAGASTSSMARFSTHSSRAALKVSSATSWVRESGGRFRMLKICFWSLFIA
jgi:hypothetical protein